MDLIAHKTKDGSEQTLLAHLEHTANLAGQFAEAFGNADWAFFAGMLHDLGKADADWQKYIRGEKNTGINHSEAGAQFAFSKMNPNDPAAKIIPYLIAGHHAGLPNWDEEKGSGNSLKSILEKTDTSYLEKLFSHSNLQTVYNTKLPKSIPLKNKTSNTNLLEHLHLWIRMLYSCLTDADFLDTEQFMAPHQARLRENYTNLQDLKKRFDNYMKEKIVSAPQSKINEIRTLVFKSCLEKAKCTPGFFSLNVPTGGGKTLSSMAFALEHAILHKKKRVIMAIPYTSIIEQSAKVYKYGTDDDSLIDEYKKNGKCLFGEENVLEHHSNFDFEKDDESEVLAKQKLETENWDAPIIVTTNVQLFESLFSAHSSSLRKLHNLLDSVIILDEAQMLPPEYLKSILSALRSLVYCFGVTVVLCTATQPALEGTIGADTAAFVGIAENQITPIIDNPKNLFENLKRVEINTDFVRNKMADWQAVCDKLCNFEQVLCIVQTRKDCRDLHALMPEGTIHLSALMCAEERSDVIAQIKDKLRKGKAVRVISTQLVECGVDIDFPVVFRSISGLDSIAQAAGRCNREGKMKCGTLYVFNPPRSIPSGILQKGSSVTQELLELHGGKLPLSQELYREYFTKYYRRINDFDTCEFEKTMQKEKQSCNFQFRTLSNNYHLINNAYQGTVYVNYCSPNGKNNFSLLEQLKNCGVNKQLLRKLNRYSVQLPLNTILKLVSEGRLLRVHENIFMQALDDKNLYQRGLGFVSDSEREYESYIF